jgi:Lrp/AsnC family transcriptional regulator of ectoine degradation
VRRRRATHWAGAHRRDRNRALGAKIRIDRTDIAILATLQQAARITNHDLAARVHLSPSSCLQRVRKLEKAGVLHSYHARIEFERIGRSVTVIAEATLNNHEQADFKRFEEAVDAIPEVVECLKVSGECDYILRFVCSDMTQYHALSERLLDTGRGVAHLSSHVVLARCKESDGYPLDRLLESSGAD